MPTYEYECTKCGTVTEVFHSITQPARRKLRKDDNAACTCKAAVTRRIGSGAGVIFKGSGFYETDYRSESYKKAAEADKSSGEKKSKKDGDSSKPEKKTAAKSESTGGKSDSSSSSD